MKHVLRWCVLAAILIAGLAAMHYFAPLQPGPLLFDLALVAILAGGVSILIPLRFLEIRSRWAGVGVLLAGVAVATASLSWPPAVHNAVRRSALDDFLPAYTEREFHTQRVHAPPARVYRAIRETTFQDVKVFVTLMQIRIGSFRKVSVPPTPILDLMTAPNSPFVLLADDGRGEIVLGTANRFWAGGRSHRFAGPEEFRDYREPGVAKSAFNFRVEDLGNGWSRISTETRVIGNDPASTRAMTRYWRVIYPGSAAIRRMWLNAIRARAEQ